MNIKIAFLFTFIIIELSSQERSISINEIMYNYKNKSGYDCSYLELFNTSNKDINLEYYYIKMGNQNLILPNVIINKGSFVIITDEKCLSNNINPDIKMNDFYIPKQSTIELYDKYGMSINKAIYDIDYYKLNNENNRSIELINPYEKCLDKDNFIPSTSTNGGTPNNKNSVIDHNFYNDKDLFVKKIYVSSKNNVKITFSNSISPYMLKDKSNFEMENNQIKALNPIYTDYYSNILNITMKYEIKLKNIYKLKISKNIYSCNKKPIQKNEFYLGIPTLLERGNIIINELLFYPKKNGAKFIEIYNNSNKFFNIKDIVISNFYISGLDTIIFNKKYIEEDNIIAPYDYLAITNSIKILKKHHKFPNENVIEIKSMPTLNHREGNICLLNNKEDVIDIIKYDYYMHSKLFSTEEKRGVSLERIDPNLATNKRDNWNSASQISNFATPGYKNSQMIQNKYSKNNDIYLEYQVFYPNNHKYRNKLKINYKFNNYGYRVSITIFDKNGSIIKKITDNTTTNTQGQFEWDGINNRGQLVRQGIYIMLFEIIDKNQNIEHIKKIFVVKN